jgi:hypothetical protein
LILFNYFKIQKAMLDPCLHGSDNHVKLKLLGCQLKYREVGVVARPKALEYSKELSECLKINPLD